MKTVLTGIKPTGNPHVGNYLGAIRPALELAHLPDTRSLLFVADYHALTTAPDPEQMRTLTYDVAATWLALGLDPAKTILYRQSDVSEIFEMAWILSCFTSKGLMNRGHAYKAKVAENEQSGREDLDHGINVGLYCYPVLMASDVLTFGTHEVPVGEDQVQHLEICRDVAQRLNTTYKDEVLVVPKPVLQKTPIVLGIDGRKMSKSYNNTIPIFCESKKLRKLVMKIKTDSTAPGEPKDPSQSQIFQMYREFASEAEVANLKQQYEKGIAWGEAKQMLFEVMDRRFEEPREKYNELMSDRSQLDEILAHGAARAKEVARVVMDRVRKSVGASVC